MPRMPRRDAPGATHHVMLRGVGRRDIFRDDLDRRELWRRTELVFAECDVACLAVAFMPNHVHYVLRTGRERLPVVMARLATGYAMYFNRRHDHVGHVFQNRYKTVAIKDDEHLRVEIRYVHMNPVRAGLVSWVDDLGDYEWTGHAALVGRRQPSFENVRDALGLFGSSTAAARKALVEFMKATPRKAIAAAPMEPLRLPQLARAIQDIAIEFGTTAEEIRSGSRRVEVVRARAVAAYVACQVHRLPAVEVALHVGVSDSATLKAAQRGGKLVAGGEGLSLKFG